MNKDSTIAIAAGLATSLIVCSTILLLALHKANERADSIERRYEDSTQHWGSKSGGTSLLTGTNINYNLRTFNSGKTWYAVELDSDWGMTIIGESEEVYPGLLDHIEAIDRLTQHVQENGAIDLSNLDNIKLLEDAGFEVRIK